MTDNLDPEAYLESIRQKLDSEFYGPRRQYTLDQINQVVASLPLLPRIVFPLAHPGKLPLADQLIEAWKHFDEWFPSAETFLENGRDNIARQRPKEAAFLFRQAVERFYHCVMLVLTLYSPKSHKLNFLRGQAEDLAPALVEAWPRADRLNRRCFELLRLAYVNARYSPHYAITAEELARISERVGVLQDLVRQVCEQRLTNLDEALPKAAE